MIPLGSAATQTFNINQEVICIDNHGVDKLITKNKKYVVKKTTYPGLITIENDIGIEGLFFVDRFQPIGAGEADSRQLWTEHAELDRIVATKCQCGAEYTDFKNNHLKYCPLYKEK